MTVNEKLYLLRQYMSANQIDAYIVPSADPHQSEYVAAHWQARKWLSGFSGSAGTLVVTQNFAGLWTDSRYFIQAENELAESDIRLMRLKIPHTPEYISWLVTMLPLDSKVGLDGWMFSAASVLEIGKALIYNNLKLFPELDFISKIWPQRPVLSVHQVFGHDAYFTGLGRGDKLQRIREAMLQQSADYHFVGSLDDVCWILNMRGKDVDYAPVVISYLLIAAKKATLFIDTQKLSPEFRNELWDDGISLAPYNSVVQILSAISKDKTVWIDPATVNYAIYSRINLPGRLVELPNPSQLFKACKNDVELNHLRKTMIHDGVAMVKFLYWLKTNIGKVPMTEISVSEKLFGYRAMQEGFQSESFETIAGYREHGAIVHYCATPASDASLEPNGLLLIDSGGQYLGGTTDITRTVALGEASSAEIFDFTHVLKGHIQLDSAIFPEGTKGFQLDILARLPLWKQGLNYGHGTGHGVGYFLSVHEGPQRISPAPTSSPDTVLLPGMVLSNEPGVYREGKHGIRIENLMVVREEFGSEYGQFLSFETLTLCPIDRSLIDIRLLDEKELGWINTYHDHVFKKLAPYLAADEVVWLDSQTKEL